MKTRCTIVVRSLSAVAIFLAALPAFTFADEDEQRFASPEAAVSALSTAAHARDRDALRSLFGLAFGELVAVDQVQATNDLAEFTEAYDQTNRLVRQSDTYCVLEVGQSHWPFPIPIMKRNGQWFFNTDAGKEELLNRRIGRNELEALKSIRAYVDAQREYASRDRDGSGVLKYAQHLASSPGTKNGLYWSPDLDGEISPLGPLVAVAQGQGYSLASRDVDEGPAPFHGYYFKILTRQGKHAAGGKYNYVINGNMIGGFALVAWPANYGESGVMTFIVNQQGRVYQKDLGPKTGKLAPSLGSYDPDSTWSVSLD